MYKRLLVTVLLFAAPALGAYVPPGGWDYIFECDQATAGTGTADSLDGTWGHDNSSDAWDGSGIGEGLPGGISALTDGETTYLRFQDTGDPRDYVGGGDPSNRKLWVTHVVNEGQPNILNTGNFIMGFRARIATGAPLDDVHPDGGSGIVPWPEEGNGYIGHDRGKGNFMMGYGTESRVGEQIGLSIAYLDSVQYNFPQKGLLTLNRLNGPTVGTGEYEPDPFDVGEGTLNAMMYDDPQDWHEFLVTVRQDLSGLGTHVVTVTIDPDEMGAGLSAEFIVTAGIDVGPNPSEWPANFIGIDLGATQQWGAIDVDYIAYQIPEPATIALLGLGGLALLRRKR